MVDGVAKKGMELRVRELIDEGRVSLGVGRCATDDAEVTIGFQNVARASTPRVPFAWIAVDFEMDGKADGFVGRLPGFHRPKGASSQTGGDQGSQQETVGFVHRHDSIATPATTLAGAGRGFV